MQTHVYSIEGPEDQVNALATKLREEGAEIFSDSPLVAACTVIQVMSMMLANMPVERQPGEAPQQVFVNRVADDPVEFRKRLNSLN